MRLLGRRVIASYSSLLTSYFATLSLSSTLAMKTMYENNNNDNKI